MMYRVFIYRRELKFSKMTRALVHITTALVAAVLLACATQTSAKGDFYEGPNVSAGEILRARGFTADELYLVTSSGYRLRMTRGRNPVLSGGRLRSKQPILFVHGVLATGNNFLINSFGAQPKDLTGLNFANTSLEQLNAQLASEPSARALPLLALNRGHEIWIVDRRGSTGSRERVATGGEGRSAPGTLTGLTQSVMRASPLDEVAELSSEQITSQLEGALRQSGIEPPARPDARDSTTTTGFLSSWWGPLVSFFKTVTSYGSFVQQVPLNLDSRFWNYSFDEQAREDFLEIVEFVCEKAESERVALVSHSSGGAIALMAQTVNPERLARRLSSSVYWSPAFSVGNETPGASAAFAVLFPILERYIGPAPPTFVTPVFQASLSLLCSNPISRATICRLFLDALYGSGGGREPAEPQLISSLLYPSSSHELAQLGQQLQYTPRTMHFYNYGPVGNARAYNNGGDGEPPRYNLSRVTTRRESISIYVGSTDMLVAPASVRLTASQLGGNFAFKEIEIPFSHVGYFFNEQAPERVIIPSMRDLELLAVE